MGEAAWEGSLLQIIKLYRKSCTKQRNKTRRGAFTKTTILHV